MLVSWWIQNARPIISPRTTSTTSRTTRKIGDACRTAVAFGVKPKNLKALGPENACPILAVVRRLGVERCETRLMRVVAL